MELYIASLPARNVRETPVHHRYASTASATRDIRLGLPEEKYMVSIEYKNHLKTKASDKICFHVLQKHFDNLFRQIIRED